MSTDTLADRMLFLIQKTTKEHRRYKELEEKTSVAADRWKAFALGRQRPTAEMIEALGKLTPQYSQWLLTGKVDALMSDQVDPTDTSSEERALINYADKLYELVTGLQPGMKPYLNRMRPDVLKKILKDAESDPYMTLLLEIEEAGHITDDQVAQLRALESKKRGDQED